MPLANRWSHQAGERQAAAQAAFPAYIIETPTPEDVWAGRFGVSGHETVSLEVVAKVGDTDVVTETHLLSHAPPLAVHLRLVVHELVRIAVPFDEAPLTLPMSLAIGSEDRTLIVEGQDITFTGLRLGQAWAGVAEVDENLGLRLVVNGSVEPARVGALKGRSLSDYQPA